MCAAMSLWNPWAAIVCETGNINQAANCSSQCDKVYFTCIESLPPLGGGGGGGGWPGPGGADNNGECSPPAGEVCPAQCSSCGGIW